WAGGEVRQLLLTKTTKGGHMFTYGGQGYVKPIRRADAHACPSRPAPAGRHVRARALAPPGDVAIRCAEGAPQPGDGRARGRALRGPDQGLSAQSALLRGGCAGGIPREGRRAGKPAAGAD